MPSEAGASPTAAAIDNHDEILAAGAFNPPLTDLGHTLETTGGTGG